MADSSSSDSAPRSDVPDRRLTDAERPAQVLVAASPDVAADVIYAAARARFEVITAHTAEQALGAVHAHAPDVLIVDRALAAQSPPELLRSVRAAPTLRHAGVVLLGTAVADEEVALGTSVEPPYDGAHVSTALVQALRDTRERAGRRRSPGGADTPTLDLTMGELLVRDARVPISPAEAAMLRLLLQHPAGVSDDRLEDAIWGGAQRLRFRGLISLAHRLRRKLLPHGVHLERARALSGYVVRW